MHTIKQQQLPLFAAALWWGCLSVIGFLCVPMLFSHLPTAAMAGQMAAKLFSANTWVSLACCFILIFTLRTPRPDYLDTPAGTPLPAPSPAATWAMALTAWILAGAVLALLSEYAVAPRIVARENLALWHRVGTGMYAAQWLCASVVLWRLASKLHWQR